jgi:hypothetical protein
MAYARCTNIHHSTPVAPHSNVTCPSGIVYRKRRTGVTQTRHMSLLHYKTCQHASTRIGRDTARLSPLLSNNHSAGLASHNSKVPLELLFPPCPTQGFRKMLRKRGLAPCHSWVLAEATRDSILTGMLLDSGSDRIRRLVAPSSEAQNGYGSR